MQFALSCVLLAATAVSIVLAQPPSYKPPEFEVCGMTVVLPCFAPEVAEYMRLGDPGEIAKKIKDDELRVICNKIETASSCLKTNVKKYCKLGSTDALEEVKDLTDLYLNHVCKKKYTIFNKAKNCKIDKAAQIAEKLNNCGRITAVMQSNLQDSDVCNILKDKEFVCRVNVFGEVCGKEFGDEVKSFLKQAADNLFKCPKLTARAYSESNGIASSLLKRALLMDPSEAMENLFELFR